MSKNIDLIKSKIKKVDTIFFDLDGVLIDTEKLYFRFWKEAASFYGYELSDEDALAMRSRDPIDAKEFFKTISNGLLDYDLVRAKRVELMDAYLLEHPIELKPFAIETLEKLKNDKKKLYIVTANKVDKATKICDFLHINEYFVAIISAKDAPRGKPFPYVYIEACKQVDKEPKDVLVFEDSPNGLKASHDAGCFTVMVEDLTPYDENMGCADGVISSLEEIIINKKTIKVVAALIRKGNTIFAAKRSYGHLKGKWEFPGGKVEKGESKEEALKREIREELSTEISVDSFFCNIKYEYEEFILDMDVFNCSIINGRLSLHKDVHSQEGFINIDDLDYGKWCPADIEILKKIKEEN